MLYKVNQADSSVTPVIQTDLVAQGFLETKHLEEWFASSSEILGRKLIWIARQDWASDSDRSDLIGIDKDAELLVVELKRGYVDMPVITQALNYASQYAVLKHDEIIQRFLEHSSRNTQAPLRRKVTSEVEARQMISDLTGAGEANDSQVLILVGTEFDPGVLSICEYLNRAVGSDGTLSVECWKMSLFQDSNTFYLQLVQILPTPDLQIQIEQLREERRATKHKRDQNKIDFMIRFKERALSEGIRVAGKQGASYACNVIIGSHQPLQVTIYDNLIINIPKVDPYVIEGLAAESLIDDGSIMAYTLRPVLWSDERDRQAAVDELIEALKLVIPGI